MNEKFKHNVDQFLILVFLISVLTVAIFTILTMSLPDPIPTVPQCQEDQVIVGQGQFNDGYWDYYTCGPALDDFGG